MNARTIIKTCASMLIIFLLCLINPKPILALIDCSTGFSSPVSGVEYKKGHITAPVEMDYYVVKVDLNDPNNHMFVTPRAFLGTTTSRFASSFGAEVAINGDLHTGLSTLGLAVSNGSIYSNVSLEPTFYSLTNGGINITNLTSPPSDIYNAVSGSHFLVRSGTIDPNFFGDCSYGCTVENEQYCCTRHPRTTVGFNGKTVIMILVDGRSEISIGATLEDVARMHVDCGSSKALNLDGEGSTALVINNSIQNNPSEGSERSVANHLGFCMGHECNQSPVAPPLPTVVPPVSTRDPVPYPYVYCDDIRPNFPLYSETEFHSLRPYEASPCNTSRSSLANRCSNDISATETITISDPYSPYSPSGVCVWTGPAYTNGSTLNCYYDNFYRTFTVGIDPYSSVLPVVGNTNWDTNAINPTQTVALNDSVKVNDYVGWYLHGTTWRSEKEPLGYQPDVEVTQLLNQTLQIKVNSKVNMETPSDEDKLINYSGPIRKLVSFDSQNQIRSQQVASAQDGNVRHNQVVACTALRSGTLRIPIIGIEIPFVNFDFVPEPCYHDGTGLFDWASINKTFRLGNLNTPPLESSYVGQVYGNFLKDYFKWRGLACASFEVSIIGSKYLFLCMDNPLSINQNSLVFQYSPLSSTEDRLGIIKTADELGSMGRDIVINSQSITWNNKENTTSAETTTGTANNESVSYFAHMQESVELMDTFQKTYAPLDLINSAQEIRYVSGVPSNKFCISDLTKYNPGDPIFGQKLTADVSVNFGFPCTFRYTCKEDCSSGTCIIVCGFTACRKNINLSIDVTSKTPLAKQLWLTTVAGNASFYKRVFPKVGTAGSTDETILDIPAESSVVHSFTNTGDGSPVQSNYDPKIYYSHLGGIKEYFLNDVQTMLRPKGFPNNDKYWWGYSSPGTPNPGGNVGVCPMPPTGYCSVDYLSNSDWGPSLAPNASQICFWESGASPTVINKSCLKCSDGIDNDSDGVTDENDDDCDGATADWSVGLFQINLHPNVRPNECPGAWAPAPAGAPFEYCKVASQSALDSCTARFQDPDYNIEVGYRIYLSQGWCAWHPADTDHCGIADCPY